MIKVFCDQKEKDLKNFWGHIVFHPTNAIEDDWGRLYLDKIAEDAGTVSPENNTLTLTMENNAVVLLELMPM